MCHLSLLLPADGVQRLATSPPVRPQRNPGVQPMHPVPHRATCGRTGTEAAGSTPPYHATTCDHGAGPHGNRYSRPETQRRRFETNPATGQRPGQRKKALAEHVRGRGARARRHSESRPAGTQRGGRTKYRNTQKKRIKPAGVCMPVLPRDSLYELRNRKGARVRALWQGVSCEKRPGDTCVHPRMPKMWHGGIFNHCPREAQIVAPATQWENMSHNALDGEVKGRKTARSRPRMNRPGNRGLSPGQLQIRKDRNTTAAQVRGSLRDRTKCLKRHLLMAERKMKLDHANSTINLQAAGQTCPKTR